MILIVESPTADRTQQAAQALYELVRTWGHTATNSMPPSDDAAPSDDKVVDLIALTALIVSIPSAALAINDLADRIAKRRRAQQLIDYATTQTQKHIHVYLHTNHQQLALHTLTTDQLLELSSNTPARRTPDHGQANPDSTNEASN